MSLLCIGARIGGILVLAALVAGCDASALNERQADSGKGRTGTAQGAPSATPAGITLQPLGKAQGYGLDKESAILLARNQIGYTDAGGMTLYIYEKDRPGLSACVDQCATIWPPALAEPDAQPTGDWSVITRPDGSRQWALRGKALYRYSKDIDIGSVAGNSPKRFGRGPNVGQRGALRGPKPEDAPMPEGWSVALAFPVAGVNLPPSFAAREVADALGIALVDEKGFTLYVGTADPKAEQKECRSAACPWLPVAAPQVAVPIGDFDFVLRDDGVRQWRWKGQALYSYTGDFAPGFANGIGVNRNWRVAYLLSYFMPPEVTVQDTPQLGKVLATAEGKSLYRRDAFIFQSGSGHSLRRGTPVRPAVGRDLGVDARCEPECTGKWQPFLAPAGAKPTAYWTLYPRSDGSKQWAYQGFALWTYAGDSQPGDINGNDSFQLAIPDRPDAKVDIGTPYDGSTALYWAAAIP